jgi:hypothetical protein
MASTASADSGAPAAADSARTSSQGTASTASAAPDSASSTGPEGARASASPGAASTSSTAPRTASAATQGASSAGAQAGTPGKFLGRIERIDRADNVTIAGSEGVGLAFEQFKVDTKTEVVTPGGKGSMTDLNEGDEVRASFSGSGEELHVDKLEVLPPKAP